jgi:hypothetical protein
MGANSGDYLREAARALVSYGLLIVCEASSRLPSDDEIRNRPGQLGFHQWIKGRFARRKLLVHPLASEARG